MVSCGLCWSDERVRHCVEKTEKMGHKLEAISASLNTVRHANQPRTESTSRGGGVQKIYCTSVHRHVDKNVLIKILFSMTNLSLWIRIHCFGSPGSGKCWNADPEPGVRKLNKINK
jgi:hypothetical protein